MNKLLRTILNPIVARFSDHDRRLASLENAVSQLLTGEKYVANKHRGFNGQDQRKIIFAELHELFDFDIVIETGTANGNTTAYISETTGLPIMTCELDTIMQRVAKRRLEDFANITFAQGDSRKFLHDLFSKNTFSEAFIYLDAHWYDDLPLAEELGIISTEFRGTAVVMIDDFQVPGDEGYGYDDYGRNKTLDMTTFSKVFTSNGFEAFFPVAPSNQETGGRRGCVVLVNRNHASRLKGSAHLRPMT